MERNERINYNTELFCPFARNKMWVMERPLGWGLWNVCVYWLLSLIVFFFYGGKISR